MFKMKFDKWFYLSAVLMTGLFWAFPALAGGAALLAIEPATTALLISGGISLISGIFGARGAKKQSQARQDAANKVAEAQFESSVRAIGLQTDLQREALALQGQTEDDLFRLQLFQLNQRTEIAASRRRSQAQIARTSGIGGSFSQIRTGRSELEAEQDRQVVSLQTSLRARAKARFIERKGIKLRNRLGLDQANVQQFATKAQVATQASAAVSQANQQLANTAVGVGTSLLQNEQITSAIAGFFSTAATGGAVEAGTGFVALP